MAKKFTYKGKNFEDIQAMKMEEFMTLINSRARRTLKRGLTDKQKKLLERVRKFKGQDKLIRARCRDMIILPEMMGAKIGIYNGQEYKPVIITHEMVGHYLGEFSQTRKRVQHSAPGFGATRSSKFVPLK
ncbi:MAG: 30S ribosomal protein S19 [Candidatus Aenigmarchaeota archaeon]|nr:30S ribosomal protein S19 [Candidatus Aenigmarchaeota archaeon]